MFMEESLRELLKLELIERGICQETYQKLNEQLKQLLERKNDRHFIKKDERKKIKIVLTGGVFDVLHIGHIVTLSEARKEGDFLVVAIASDDHIRKKGREPVHPIEYRKILVENLKMVDLAIAGFRDPKEMLDLVKPDVIVYGYDQKDFLKPQGVKIVKIQKHLEEAKYKSGKIIEKIGI